MSLTLSDQDILDKLRKGETHVMKYCYESSYPKVLSMIKKNGGTESDAEDIFQEVLIVFYRNSIKPAFELTASLSTYLYSIAWRMWMKNIRDSKGSNLELMEESAVTDEFDFEFYIEENDLLSSVLEAMDQAGKRCKEILQLFYFNKLGFQDISDKLGMSNERAVREQKYRCMKRIKELVNPG